MIAAHAAVALCPRCNRPVRTGVELHAAAADLTALAGSLAPLRHASPSDRDLYEGMACLIHHYALELRAELSGEHLNCEASGVNQDLVDVALSRAAECAARDGAHLH